MTMGRGKDPVRRASAALMAGVKVQMRNTVNKIQMNIKYVAIATTNDKLKINDITGMPLGGQCWNQTSGAASQRCSSGTECLPWTPGGGSRYCLYSPPLTEGAECDYWERKGPCEEGLNCTDGWCKGTLSSRWPQNSCIILQGSLQVANVGARTVELPHKDAALALSVSPGPLGEAPGMGPAPSTASDPSLWHI